METAQRGLMRKNAWRENKRNWYLKMTLGSFLGLKLFTTDGHYRNIPKIIVHWCNPLERPPCPVFTMFRSTQVHQMQTK
ncbi:MAG: hypothetical protein CO150_04725 [Nitrospirae bacterium CG_4_9_14_3_um_filter_53_35]|nr:MAG: hypothetical protein COT35_10100 [Nitrospirae bacterium CG08_land_8_20_14_0_20_52_24]PIV85648.1 MAG: hypothetical protein COW52_01095 [Nitrospirae bacterium CG17_big_fil_post_rev_8_21_14_2_50_50_9]PIW84404.1 MAG: hypothetical protein COZ95_09955 [Nitrospirae bacterium CG_4_8_14_3_um_filter_50_41]PJA75422.1 MAG: hypothetical protein CO150_04725 [Nitrospirae bacterium CG_4_9_14_3_um_filter_53_35]